MSNAQIIVTGASRGIGASIMSDLSGRGFNVVGLSRTGEVPDGQGMPCDITDENAVREVFKKISDAAPIVGLINNAGVHISSPSAQLETREYEEVMALNARSVMVSCREAYPYLKEAGGGTIVNIGSFFDKLGVAENVAYCASKAAVGAITRCLAVEWAADRISVHNVAPGYIETDLNRDFLGQEKVQKWLASRVPVGRAGQPEEVARLVGAILTEGISFMTGETIYIDGAQGIYHK